MNLSILYVFIHKCYKNWNRSEGVSVQKKKNFPYNVVSLISFLFLLYL